MPFPSYAQIREQIRVVLGDGEPRSSEELRSRLGGHFGLSEEELSEVKPGPGPDGTQNRWTNDVAHVLARPQGDFERLAGGLYRIVTSAEPKSVDLSIVTRDAVQVALAEYDELGRDQFLLKYGYGRARDYVLVRDEKEYDSKAILGVAYGKVSPDGVPLRSAQFSGGEQTTRRLEQLGFEIRRLTRSTRAWTIRAGVPEGRYEQLALEQGVCVIGWSDLGALSPDFSREDLKAQVEVTYDEHRPHALGDVASQIHRFIHDVAVDDLVVLPLMSNRGHVAVGQVRGEYLHRTDGPFADTDAQHTRWVDWLAKELPYSRFDPDLQEAFGYQGTLREITKPDAAARILAVLEGADASALHLVVKSSVRFGAGTIEQAMKILEEHGAVWWGVVGLDDRASQAPEWMDAISAQLTSATPTNVFISGPTCWSTSLQELAESREAVDEQLIPSVVPSDLDQTLWLKLTGFQPVDRAWLTEHLELVSVPGKPLSEGTLSDPTNPLIVRRAEWRIQTRRVWWVCQGQTYASARDLGVLWAPKVARDGAGRPYWRALQDARVGDLVVHYADNHIRAVSTVVEEAVDAPRPEGMSGDWVEGDGWLVRSGYQELDRPLPLSQIPLDWRIEEHGPFTQQGSVQQGYFFPLSDRFVNHLARFLPQLGGSHDRAGEPESAVAYSEPPFAEIETAIAARGLRISTRDLRRYHVSLKTRGFVVLAGVSGSGKTWLAEAYADVIGAEQLRVSVAPNWTTNEDLLGYRNPIDGAYRHTDFSRFLLRAATEYSSAQGEDREARPFHLILDEMNLARVEYYFAKFLSAMEARARYGTAPIVLADDLEAQLTPNLKFIGTVNIDETTLGFADKVYDRSQLIELEAPWEALAAHMHGKPYASVLHDVWEAVHEIAPFAFRIVDEFDAYATESDQLSVSWQEAVDDQLLQKVLPKIKGTDPRIRDALESFLAATSGAFPLSHDKATKMLDTFNAHGFVSFF